MNGIGKRLEEYRLQKNLTQKDLANLLGITQVHVSRVEKEKANISKRLLAKILTLIGEFGEGYGFEAKTIDDGSWKYAIFNYGDNSSGDRIRINQKRFKDKTYIAHCDASGSDTLAARMADNIILTFESGLANFTTSTNCTVESLYVSMDETVKSTPEFWRGEPSLNLFSMNKFADKVTLLNAGMPNLFLYNTDAVALKKFPEKKWPPIGTLKRGNFPYSEDFSLKHGDSLCSFSDGFIEIFDDVSNLNLEKYLFSLCSALKGDGESIGLKLLKELEKGLKGKGLNDNLSFIIIYKTVNKQMSLL